MPTDRLIQECALVFVNLQEVQRQDPALLRTKA